MIMLAIETSQRLGEVAVRDRDHDGAIHVERLAGSRRHDDDLLPAIDRLFTRLKLNPVDLKGGAVAVSIGPGGFTGLRIAVSTAKMFAETLGVKLVGVPSAMVVAEASRDVPVTVGSDIVVALASKNESAWYTRLKREANGAWMIINEPPPGLCEANSLALNGVAAMFADEHLPGAMRECCAAAGVPIIAPTFSAAACLIAGARMLERGESTDPLRLLPLYPRQPEAVTLWDARHGEKSTSQHVEKSK